MKDTQQVIKAIASFAEKQNLKYFFGGGIALAIQAGEFYRENDDIDFHPIETDGHIWKPFLRELGYELVLVEDFDEFPYAFVGKSGDKVEIEVFPVKYLNRVIIGNWRGIDYGEFYDKEIADIQEVEFEGTTYSVEDYKKVLEQKKFESRDEGLREKDRIDFEKFNINPESM